MPIGRGGNSGRLVKIFMRRDCSTGVSRQGVLDSGCHVADRAQAEKGQGRAARSGSGHNAAIFYANVLHAMFVQRNGK